MSFPKRALFTFSLFLTFWVVTFAFSALQEYVPINTHLDFEYHESDFVPEPERTFLPATDSIYAKELWTYECELVIQRPTTMTNTCADFGEVVHSIKWKTWGRGIATGSGIYSINDCDPDCADGTRHESPVDVVLSDLTHEKDKYFLNTFTFTSKSGDVLPNTYSPDGSWDISEFYRMVPEMHENS